MNFVEKMALSTLINLFLLILLEFDVVLAIWIQRAFNGVEGRVVTFVTNRS